MIEEKSFNSYKPNFYFAKFLFLTNNFQYLFILANKKEQQIEGPNQSQQQTSLNNSSDQQVDNNFQTSRNGLLNNISSTIRITQQNQTNTLSTLNGFSVSNQSTVQLAQGEIVDNFYYSETLKCFFVITEQQNFIYFNPNATDISSRQQLIFNVSQRKDDKKFIRKFYYSETYQYMIVLYDNQPTYMFNNFNQNLFSNSSSLSSLIEVYMFSVNSENMIKVQFQIQVSEILTGATLMSPIIDFSVSSSDSKFMYLTNQNIQVYETNILGNIQFYPTFNLQNTNSQNPFSNGFSKLYFSQNLIIIMNNLQGLICYRMDTKLWYAGIITYTNPTFQFIYQSKTFFIFFGTNIQQGSLTTFQLVLQDTPINNALNNTNISLFSSIPLFITISQNFMLAVFQSSTVAIYQIVYNNSSSSQFNFVLSQTLQIQHNIIQLQMTSYALVILNYKQLSIFSRINISTPPVQTNYVSLDASQNVWQTSSNSQQASFCAFYNNTVYILSSSSIFISSQNQAISSIPVTNSNPIILFGVFAYPPSYYYLDSMLNLTSDLILNTIGGNVVEYYTTKATKLRIESAVLIFCFIQKISSLLLPSTVQSLQSIGQITNDGYIVQNGLQSAFKILSLPQSEQSIIMNSIIRVHYLVQIQETLQFDELNLLAFTTSSKNVQLSFNMKNNYYQFILKNIYTSEVSENLNWQIVNNSFGLIIQGTPSNIQKFLSYFMIKPAKQSTVPSQETINILFSDFLNSSKNITLKLQDFLNNNLQLFKQVEGLKLNQSLQSVFNQIYDASNLKIDNIYFSIPDAIFQDSDIPKNSHLSQQSILQYQEKNKENIIYYYYHTTQKGDLDFNQIQVGQNSIDYLSSYNGVAISQNNFMIDTNNFREKGLLTNKIEYHRIIICAQNEINQICDDIEFTLGISNPLDILLILLTPICSALVFYWIYQRYYVIKFFYNMNKITFSDEKVYSNNNYHKQIPIITDQFEIAKELWSIYKVIRIDKIEQRIYEEKLNLYDDEENIAAKLFEQNIRKTSEIATTQQASGQNNQNGIEINQINIENNLGTKVNSSKKIESHNNEENDVSKNPSTPDNQNSTTPDNQNSTTPDNQNSTTPDNQNSIIRPQLNQELRNSTFSIFSNASPINQEQIANAEVENNDQFSIQNPNLITLNSEQNSPILRSQFYRHNNHNHSIIRENNIDQINMSLLSQLEKSDSGGSQYNSYQSYQEFIYKNKKIQLVQANGNIITNQLKESQAESQGYLSFTKYQGPLLSSYQASQLQVIIESQKIEDDRNQRIFQKCFQENNIQFNKTNSFIVRDLINNSRIFNQKVYDLWKNMQVVNPVQLNDTPENSQLLDNYDSPRSNRQAYKKNASSGSVLKKIQLKQQKKNLVILSKNVNEQVEKIKGSFSKLIRDQLDLKDQLNKRLQNLKEENIIDEFSGINEDILLNDIKKTLTDYFQTKIQQRLNVTKFKFLLNQVQTITSRKDALSRYLFVECARHILSIDSISKYIYDYLKKLALLYNNSNDWYKSYLFIIGHNQDNQIYPFPSIVVKDDMVQQAFFDLGIRFPGKEAQYKEKIKIVGQALVADALDLNKYSNNCGESLYLSPDDQILSIRAINIPEKSIGGKMRQFKNFVSWMIGNFDKQQLLNNMYIPEWMSCDITNNTLHIKGNPNNSQIGRYLIIISGKRKHILRSFILRVLKSNSYNQSHSTQSNQIIMPFESDGSLFSNILGKNEIEVQSPLIGIKQVEIKQQQIEQQQLQQQQPQPQPFRLKSKSKVKQKEGQANSDLSISGNKYLPRTKSIFQKSTLPLKSSSNKNSPNSYKSTIQVKGEAGQPRLRGFTEYVETYKDQIHHQDQIARPKSSELIEEHKNNQDNLKPVSEEEENYDESSFKSSFVSENINIFNQISPHLDYVIEPKFFPDIKDISENILYTSSNDLQTQ